MAGSFASGIETNWHYDDNEWYTTKVEDEVIFFKGEDGNLRTFTSWIIFAETNKIGISMIRRSGNRPDETVGYQTGRITIGANASWSNEILSFDGILVHGLAGQKIKWMGNY